MNWIGALLLISTTTWLGFDWSNRLSNRPKQIRQLKNALQILEAEIVYSQLPLKEAFLNISRQIPEPTRFFFEEIGLSLQDKNIDFYIIWKEKVDALINNSSLAINEKEILYQFGRTIGQHDFYQQQKHIQLTLSHLERELEDAREEQYKYSKMAKSLGFLAGLFIVLLLI
ncbi:stage III sporulation protein SpoIIIAB [Oceanobacillus caeni]|uniref:Stage III sporulation protein AB n=1 Tax=Oceanobacillus caeni TaxID=405946 RepID=A0ABR5MKQ7_9BACI|nr:MULTISPECIES: stage III sporulation protein SpoIIIAB [Bacillaceae]KKE80656.1 stage III sporulation protein AB [Bacilli bacterium VT-13-104]PZD85320.1 stage III sporulation protein SpoAB [Bacilli bacterium]KPH76412.1 stage III sporulation protein AB [Oceanobacillus caeni]MBU8789827.1 stage III sporulation protein SpoAB [Oceanobacillus caeni]MCR1834937.1 stage III sporulation protein SpoIIIAB [Oceanobacillus caeni]